jgi:DtxR family Mn-dependent transcriptional regulator
MILSQTVEDYLKTIFKIQEEGRATTSKIASEMEVSSASVTNRMKRLGEMGLLEYASYQGVELTESGSKIALEVIRHHRLLELYLKEMLGYSWDEVHEEAEKLEHHISERFEDRIAEMLDEPTHDPHGDPIPSKEGDMPAAEAQRLIDAERKTDLIVRRVTNQDPELLRHLDDIGLIPGVKVNVKKQAPYDGPLTVQVEDHEQVIGRKVADSILVSPYESPSH